MSLYYLDTSAALKLLVEARHSNAFADFYDRNADASWVSSSLLRIELSRAVTRAIPVALPEARELLSAFDYISIDEEVVESAMNEPDSRLRTLDAIHLSTARILGEELDGLVSYDHRLTAAAIDAGLPTLGPQDQGEARVDD